MSWMLKLLTFINNINIICITSINHIMKLIWLIPLEGAALGRSYLRNSQINRPIDPTDPHLTCLSSFPTFLIEISSESFFFLLGWQNLSPPAAKRNNVSFTELRPSPAAMNCVIENDAGTIVDTSSSYGRKLLVFTVRLGTGLEVKIGRWGKID